MYASTLVRNRSKLIYIGPTYRPRSYHSTRGHPRKCYYIYCRLRRYQHYLLSSSLPSSTHSSSFQLDHRTVHTLNQKLERPTSSVLFTLSITLIPLTAYLPIGFLTSANLVSMCNLCYLLHAYLCADHSIQGPCHSRWQQNWPAWWRGHEWGSWGRDHSYYEWVQGVYTNLS